jgi:hypothetical protein
VHYSCAVSNYTAQRCQVFQSRFDIYSSSVSAAPRCFAYQVIFLVSFDDPGPHGQGRYMDQMMPEVHRSDWRKGAQVCLNFHESYFVM